MSEPEQSPAPDAVAPTGASAGTLLREAREAAGLHIAALAVALKVPVRKLEALEADQLDQLPDAVFVRALASSVCRTLKVDPAPVLELLPQTTAPRLAPAESGINAPFRAPSDVAGSPWVDQLSKPVFLAVFALLLGALVLIFLPTARQTGSTSAAGEPAGTLAVAPPAPAAATPAPAPAVLAVATVAPPVPAQSAPPTGQAQTTVAVTPGLSAAVSTPTVASPTLVVTPAATATVAQPAPLPTTGVVVFKTRSESWVEVTDARGVVVVRKIIAPGETVGASGAPPLAVVVGRADVTEVQVRGKPFDLSPLARDNVARFEVK